MPSGRGPSWECARGRLSAEVLAGPWGLDPIPKAGDRSLTHEAWVGF